MVPLQGILSREITVNQEYSDMVKRNICSGENDTERKWKPEELPRQYKSQNRFRLLNDPNVFADSTVLSGNERI